MNMDWRMVHYDAIVVGSGAAGGMAAKSLTDGGASVLLLEAGPEIPLESCRPQPRSREQFDRIRARQAIQSQNLGYNKETCHLFIDDQDNPYSTEASTEFNWIRSRLAGGRTLVWSRFALRMSDEDFKSAEEDGIGIPWPIGYNDLASYYDWVEQLVGVKGTKESLSCLPDGHFLPRHVPDYLKSLRHQVAQRWPDRHLLPSREVVDDREMMKSAPPSYSSLGSTLRRCDPRKLTFRANCAVARITLGTPKAARGVVFVERTTGQWHEVLGRTIILCASPIESVRLLLASKTPDHPHGLGNSSGVLGHYLLDHFGGARFVAVGKLRSMDSSSTERVYLPRFCNREQRDEGFVRGYGIQGELQVCQGGSALLSLGIFGEVLPYFENSVVIDEALRDVLGLPVPKICFKYQENERKMAQRSAVEVRELMASIGFRPLVEQDNLLPPGTRAHELGGARMGASPSTSVLNAFNQCWDISNLFVTDGSCFPSAGYKGPTLTVMALTARACAYILRDLREGRF